MGNRVELQRALEDATVVQSEQYEMAKALQRELDPYFRQRRSIQGLIMRTHNWISGEDAEKAGLPNAAPRYDYVRAYDRTGISVRDELFAELDRLAEVYGPMCEQRRVAMAEAEAASRAADRIRELLAKPPPKPTKERATQFNLFAPQKDD